MWWRVCTVIVACMGVGLVAGGQAVPWHEHLSYPGDGYWTVRVPVEVENRSDLPLAGTPVALRIQAGDGADSLSGEPAESLRVVTAGGTELLFDVLTSGGARKGAGALEPGDEIVVPVEAEAGARAVLYLYAGNPRAWRPMDELRAVLANPGFESADGWETVSVDAAHRMTIQDGGAHTGARCARSDVDPGAESTWVKFAQSGLPVAPGQRYRFTAWVKAENVAGKAGWFVHVNGDRPQMVNQLAGWDGAFDWREVVLEFEAPEGSRSFTCGTVLYGTGTAWYDDARLERVSEDTRLAVSVGAAERIALASAPPTPPQWPSPEYDLCVPVSLRNFTDEAAARLFGLDTRRIANQQFKLAGNSWAAEVVLLDSDGRSLAVWGDFREDLYVAASVPARTERCVWLFSRALPEEGPGAGPRAGAPNAFASLSSRPENLLANGSIEQGEGEVPDVWESSEEGRTDGGRYRMRRVPGGVDEAHCLELRIPENTEHPDWFGWRQRVDVKPNTQYLLSGSIKGNGLDASAAIHLHTHRGDGSLTESPYASTGPHIAGTQDWTETRLVFTTPPDCAYVTLHLTMNCHGTLWHDALTLIESGQGVPGEILTRDAPDRLHAWRVNPLIKTFPHDVRPPDAPTGAVVYAARNTRQTVQLALRSPREDLVRVAASPLTGPEGAVLAAPAVALAEYVPIDFPIGYHNSTRPDYCRLLPEHRGTDGWPGAWPDALVPVDGPVPLAANQTIALWFELEAPADARPGDYTGTVSLRGGDTAVDVPITATVWNFAVPDAKQLPALYDLRHGPGWNVFSGEDRQGRIRQWCDFLARYNVSPALTIESPRFALENGRVTMDTAAFDAYASYVFDALNVNVLYTPHDFYACGWAYEPRDFLGFKAFTPEYVEAWTSAYRQFIDHVTAKGWRGRFVQYLSDEPFESSEKTITGLARVADMARSVAPDVPVYSSTWHYIEGLEGHLTLWGVGIHESFPLEKMRERQAAGDRFWFTTDGHMCTDTPFLGVERLLPWLCLKYGVEGYEFWGVSWWTCDPHTCGWHKYIRQSNEGQDYYWVRYPNGDGFLAYPPRDAEAGAPLPTIRLVAARDGVDDYELFLALRKHASAGNADAQAALDRVFAAVTMTQPNGRYSTRLMPDPDEILAARTQAGNLLSRLNSAAEEPER